MRPLVVYLMYGAMIGVPALMMLELLAKVLVISSAANIIMVLIALGLVCYFIAGLSEVYAYQLKGGEYEPRIASIIMARSYAKQTAVGGKPTYINITVTRYNDTEKRLERHDYKIGVGEHTTLLEALLAIRAYQDSTLAVRYSCRMGICGSCAMVINGKPSLACETLALKQSSNSQIEVAPMEGHPLLKDLVVDMGDFFSKHASVSPHLMRSDNDKFNAKKQLKQTTKQLDEYLPYSNCIMCGLCLDACPVVNTNPEFVGPQALSQVYRYYKDSRDQSEQKRLDYIDTLTGAWGCEFAGACSKVCPKGVDPAAAIQMLKGELIEKSIKGEEEK